ncbi:leucine-rich repeat domain-containing protein [Streptomyces phaeoluteigriseus]|uniref:Leucine-rich repeat domain-containing protein n=1 Tax=Streptomyces phaeoluteigriseus TaxID=114686 RepID=A0ABY4Z083_9ACTN|nr:leucine-rich repeat domain-containing protein [Streptomyces phaeoluteigriseus]USQ82447.1 leucine-rich repeat domain-containing protein [Streptomyces phaeoluteigriseus]
MEQGGEPRLFANRWAAAGGRGDACDPPRDTCACLEKRPGGPPPDVRFHADRQDTSAPGWLHLLELVDEAVADGREVFSPLTELPPRERRQIITLPPSIARLREVRHLVLYGSNLVRLPPEIGAMESLEEFDPYTSYRLHWFPYELTRCPALTRSTVSTRALYGNRTYRPPFPRLAPHPPQGRPGDLHPVTRGTRAVTACSVCAGPVDLPRLHQVWISLRVATDVLPLLVNACSRSCVDALPTPPDGYVATPHRGGPEVLQPAERR